MSNESEKFNSKFLILFACLAMASQGCVHGISSHRDKIKANAIPAHRLPQEFRAPSRDRLVPLDFTQLRRTPIKDHVVGPRDVLGIYIEDVLAVENQLPPVFYPNVNGADPLVQVPSVGHPVKVQEDGTVVLPIVGAVNISGLTLPQAVEKIKEVYGEEAITTDKTFVSVDLIRPRTVEVFVIREDAASNSVAFKNRTTEVYAKRGSAQVLELAAYENDILHALSETGGLPGVDAFNEIWVLRGAEVNEEQRMVIMDQLQSDPDSIVGSPHESHFVRIPLRVCPGQQLPFAPADVVLHDGDVVFIESREVEYFTTGGLISGGKFPLPRDHDTDILEAIAIANSSVNGPTGNSTATNFRSGPGNIVAATDVVIVRQLPSGEQIKILVDLRIAVNDPNERISVLPRDLILLRYKPTELLSNIALNFINFNYQVQ